MEIDVCFQEKKITYHVYNVSLQFSGDQLEPSEITARLNLQPSKVFNKSENLPWQRQRCSCWEYNGKGEVGYQFGWEFLEDGLEFLVATLNSRKAEIIAIGRQFEGYWWCSHFQASFNGGPKLPSKLLAEMGSYGIPLYIDTYFN